MDIFETLENIKEQEFSKKALLCTKILLESKIDSRETELLKIGKAGEVLSIVAKKTQSQLEYRISELVSLSLSSVFRIDPYEFVLQFVQRRNKTEADLLFKRGDNLIKPLEACGGGAVDIAAFALRLVCWSINKPKKRSVMILDEPFRYLSKDKHELASDMVLELAKRLDMQIIMSTHSVAIGQSAKSGSSVSIDKKVSIVS